MATRRAPALVAKILALSGEPPVPGQAPRSKYGNRKAVVDGLVFDSQREAARWVQLRLLQQAGVIASLQRQVRYEIVVNGVHIGAYVADFAYVENATLKVEDVKGVRTPHYKWKRALMKAVHGIEIIEV